MAQTIAAISASVPLLSGLTHAVLREREETLTHRVTRHIVDRS